MWHVRRLVGSGLAVPTGALLAALTLTHALAQPAPRPLGGGLRPSLDENDESQSRDTQRRDTRRTTTRRPDTRPAGTLPTFDNSQTTELPRFGTPPGSGAGNSGFLSTNRRRAPLRRDAKKQTTTGATSGTPLSLTAPGTSPTAALLRATAAGTSAAPATTASTTNPATAPAAATTQAVANQRAPLVRIPDGTAGGGVAGTVNTKQLSTASATLLRRRTAAEEDPFAQLGGHAGTFLLLPAIETTTGFDTNPARTPSGRSSLFTTVSPELIARSDWTRHEMTATLRGSYTAYERTPELDRPSFDGKVTGRIDITRDQRLDLEARAIVGTDNPGSPNVQAGLTRFPIYTTLGGTAGYTKRFNRVELTAKGTVERTQYEQSQFTDGTSADNDDRNFNRYGGSLRTSYDLLPGLKPFVEFGADTREHDLAFDRSGLQRDSVGWQLKGGTTFEFSRKLTGEVAVGWIQRNYQDPTLQPLEGVLFDASLIYAMNALTNFKLTASTVAAETTVAGTAGTLTRNMGVEVEHAFRRWLVGTAKFNYGFDDYIGSTRKDDRYSVSAALTYKLNRMAQIKGEFRQEWSTSTQPGVDYSASIFMLGARLQY
jgi:hypothetical protein